MLWTQERELCTSEQVNDYFILKWVLGWQIVLAWEPVRNGDLQAPRDLQRQNLPQAVGGGGEEEKKDSGLSLKVTVTSQPELLGTDGLEAMPKFLEADTRVHF